MTVIILSQIFAIVSLFCIVILGIVVLNKGFKMAINRIFFLFTLVLAIWLFGTFMILSSSTEELVVFWDRFVYAGVVFFPSLQYHFGLSVTYFDLKRKILLYFSYVFSLIFLFLTPSDNFVSGVFRHAWGVHTKAQTYHHFFILFFLVFTSLCLYVVLKKYYSEKDNSEKNRLLLYALGFVILNFIGGSGFLPAYSIGVPPFSLVAPILFTLMIAYSIVYFNSMDIKLVVRSYFAYFLSFITVILPAYLLLFIVNFYYPKFTFVSSVLIYSFAILIFSPVKKFFYKISNELFFASLYDFNQLVYNLSITIHSSFDINKIFKSILSLFTEAFHPKAVAAFVYDVNSERINVYYKKGFSKLKDKKIKINSQKIDLLFSENKAKKIMDLRADLFGGSCLMLDYFEKMGVHLVLPIKTKSRQLVYFLVFADKESGESYNKRDLKVLELVSFELGMSLENIFLYQDVKGFNIKLKKEINKATVKLKKQNKSLMELDKMKDEFVSVVSHQLRTPLTGIRWSTEALLRNREKNLKKQQLQLLNQIKTSGLSLIKLVNDLLDVSRIQLGRKFSINKSSFNVHEIIQEAYQDNLFLIESKDLIIKNEINPNLQIRADRDKIKQVIQNLFSNACKYSSNKGLIKISLEQTKEKISIFFKDNGIGVPKEQKDYLFTKFFRADNASLQNVTGTGLGLYIAREITKAHKGNLFYKANKPQGSIFYLELPNI